MLKLELLQQMLVIAIALSTITCAFVQKTKRFFKKCRYLCLYSFFVNMGIGIIFCITFTNITFPTSLWIGLFSFLGADTIYKSLEGKLASHKDLVTTDTISVKRANIINTEGDTDGKTSIS